MIDDFDFAHVDFDAVAPAIGVSSGGRKAASMVFGLECALVAFGEQVDVQVCLIDADASLRSA